MYTLQGLFLSTHPVVLSNIGCVGVLTLGLGGYALFRAVNAAKDRFRKEMKRLDAVAEAHNALNGTNGKKSNGSSNHNHSSTSSNNTTTTLRHRGETAVEDDDDDDDNAQHREEPAPMHQGKMVSYRGQSVYEIPYQTWGAPTRYLAARYHTGRGNEIRHSYLLLSGFWGMRFVISTNCTHLLRVDEVIDSLSSVLLSFFFVAFLVVT
jgi:hypothetical protein